MLFTPVTFKNTKVKNRIMLAPMCQYSATSKGLPTSWHFIHYATRAIGGAGLIMFEATAVESRGRISDRDLGLWNDEQIEPLKRIVEECKRHGTTVGVQLAHAGRKCGVTGEEIVAPSGWNWSTEYKVPLELSREEIKEVVRHFQDAAQRAQEAGFEVIELHAAHGYLLHEFLSPLSNRRTDEYGGSASNRMKILNEVVSSVREIWNKPLFIRVSADDYLEGGININEMVKLLSYLNKDAVDLIHVSSGGLLPAEINLYQGYQVRYAGQIKKELGFKTAAVGLITDPAFAEDVLLTGQADMITLGRELLRNPYWPLQAAQSTGDEIDWPVQYQRAKLTNI